MFIYASKICECEDVVTTTTTTSTTSTTTTTSTTQAPNIEITNNTVDGIITNVTVDGVIAGITFPIGPGQSATGIANTGSFVSIIISLGGTLTNSSFVITDSTLIPNCQAAVAGASAAFGDVANSPMTTIVLNPTPC